MSGLFKDHILNATKYRGGKGKPLCTSREIIKLSSNENQFGSSPKAIQAMANHLETLHEYPDPDDAKLRGALAAHYKNKLTEDHFFSAPSGSEIIDIICRGFLELGDEVLVCSPTFAPFKVFSERCGAKVIDVPLKQGDFELDLSSLFAAISDRTKLIFLASPNNPVGNYVPKHQLHRLLENLPDDVVLVLDEVYHHYVDADDYSTALDFVVLGKKVIGLNSFSKVYGLAGLRLGYGYATAEIASYLRILCKPFILSTLALQAGIAALKDLDFVAHTVENNRRQKLYLYHRFDELALQYWPTQANFIMIKPPLSPSVFENKMFDLGIMVRPVENFGAKGCVRISVGRPDQNLKLVSAMQQVLGGVQAHSSKMASEC